MPSSDALASHIQTKLLGNSPIMFLFAQTSLFCHSCTRSGIPSPVVTVWLWAFSALVRTLWRSFPQATIPITTWTGIFPRVIIPWLTSRGGRFWCLARALGFRELSLISLTLSQPIPSCSHGMGYFNYFGSSYYSSKRRILWVEFILPQVGLDVGIEAKPYFSHLVSFADIAN
jgi:hypothetical protein